MERWARDWHCCQECGTTEIPHRAHGLCEQCYYRQWYQTNKDKQREYHCQWHRAHKKTRAERDRQWYEANRSEKLEYARQYRQAHPADPDNNREKCRRYRAHKYGAKVQSIDEAAIYSHDGHMCLYCGATKDLTLDHIVALNNGGAHSEGNLVVACRSCNGGKRDKPLMEWLQIQPQALAWVM